MYNIQKDVTYVYKYTFDKIWIYKHLITDRMPVEPVNIMPLFYQRQTLCILLFNIYEEMWFVELFAVTVNHEV
jgi:hypothetical protein